MYSLNGQFTRPHSLYALLLSRADTESMLLPKQLIYAMVSIYTCAQTTYTTVSAEMGLTHPVKVNKYCPVT